ncbi:outer membrane beta-barrel protein [Thermocrinis minervae]|uniref:Putative beta-barrel porin-2, OmpL-like. bbp2 n=1 Tax=Thermocrinis minervae TaxID=381751 RepID=A0A1M6QV31_9AQUI|nr:outer membrane beta-barrel protein [Thermocrinis minervae]SHK24122.1 Putative beta-barrel porin-2, OmpL-like. bbp2 [Thermocrinis minervae]
MATLSKLMKFISIPGSVTALLSTSYALELKGDTFGTLNLSGAITGYMVYTDNKSDNKRIRYDVGSALISLSKTPEPIGFTIVGGAYSFPVVGAPLSKASDYTSLYSAIPIAYLEISPSKRFSLQVGKLPTLIGYESPFTYQNNYIQRGLIWNMQPVIHNGLRFVYTADVFTLKAGVNDGFYTLSTSNPKPAFEGSIALTPIKDLSLSFNLLIPDTSSRPNNREYNAVISYSVGKLSFGMDFVYVESPHTPSKAEAEGGCLHLSYAFNDKLKLSSRLEYVKDKSGDGVDLVGLGDGNKGYTFTISPSYTKGNLFGRVELSYVKADKPFTQNLKDHQTRMAMEVGFLF